MLQLQKGGKLNLAKAGGLDFVKVGLGWSEKKFDTQQDFDLDATAFVLREDGSPFGAVLAIPPQKDGWVCYYNQQNIGNGAVVSSGDNRTGSGEGDDESIEIDFKKLPPEASRVAIVITIHEAAERKQNFGQIEKAYATIYDNTGAERAKFQLDEDASTATALLFVEFKKNDSGEWVLNAVGEGFQKGLSDFCTAFKVPGF